MLHLLRPYILTAQALNTVLAFVSSRKHLAITFPVIRSSVEGLLKRLNVSPFYDHSTDISDPNRPLDLAKVAELKCVTPTFMSMPTDSCLGRSSPISSNSRTYPATSYAYMPKRSLNNNAVDGGAPTSQYLLRPSFLVWKKRSTFWFSSLRRTQRGEKSNPCRFNIDTRRCLIMTVPFFSTGLSLPPAMTPAQTKKLIEHRDERFTRAVNE